MGFARKREDQDGRTRYTAVYRDLRGRIRSAGTFPAGDKPTGRGSEQRAG